MTDPTPNPKPNPKPCLTVQSPKRPGATHALIDRMMHLSTAHIPADLVKEIEHGTSCMDGIAYQPIRDYGWLCYVDTDLTSNAKSYPAAHFTDLVIIEKCYEFAKKHGCKWLMFDCDAAIDPALPVFEW